jgi:hypothetical protein
MDRSQNIKEMSSKVMDTLYIGDSLYYANANSGILKQVQESNSDIKNKNKILSEKVQKNNAIIERANRDFTDLKDELPEKLEDNKINLVEDYTLLFLFISYVFMLIACIYLYTQITMDELSIMITKIIIGAAFITMFFMMLLYYLA